MLAQELFPGIGGLKTIGDLGYLVIIALVALVLAIVLVISMYIQLRRESTDAKVQEKEETRLDRLIDQMIQLVGEFRADKNVMRQIIEENTTSQRSVTEAATVQTGEIRLLRTDFKSYTSVQSDSFLEFEKTMVAFQGEIKTAIEKMLTSQTETQKRVNEAVENHKVIISKLDHIIALQPPPTPPNIVTVNTGTPAAPLDELPKAAGQ